MRTYYIAKIINDSSVLDRNLSSFSFKYSIGFRRKILRNLNSRVILCLTGIFNAFFCIFTFLLFLRIPNLFPNHAFIAVIVSFYQMYIFVLINYAFRFELKSRRNAKARKLFYNVKKGNKENFIFYIRSFCCDKSNIFKFGVFPFNFSMITIASQNTLDHFLLKSTPQDSSIIKIGGDRRSFLSLSDIGTIYFSRKEEDQYTWKSAFYTLAHNARIIVTTPFLEENNSILNEIIWLRDNNMLNKTMIIMPKEGYISKELITRRDINLHREGVKISDLWNRDLEEITKKGINIPRHFRKGGYITFQNNTGNLHNFYGGTNWRTISTLKRLLRGHDTPSAIKSSLWFAVRQFFYLHIIVFSYHSH